MHISMFVVASDCD